LSEPGVPAPARGVTIAVCGAVGALCGSAGALVDDELGPEMLLQVLLTV